MPMEREAYEAILNDLLNPELEQSRRTELLQNLRVDYGTVINEHEEHTGRIKKLSEDNSDLVVSNSKLFRQIGLTDKTDKKEEEKKEFSETITISQLEGE
jgi:mRNA degradation ribonuclease J1/J2